jgi:hypothetical protein
MQRQMEERFCVVVRSTPEFMRFGTREAALHSLAIMEIQELNQLLMALVITCIRIKLQQRRARLAGFDTTSLFRRLRLLIRMIGLVFYTISIMLMPQLVTLHPMVPMFRSIDACHQSWCWQHTRFRKRELPELLRLSRLPPMCSFDNKAKLPGETLLLVSLFSLANLHTQEAVAAVFGFSDQSVVSRAKNFFVVHLNATFGHLLQPTMDDDDAFLCWASQMRRFKLKIASISRDARFADVCMFTDGTFRATDRPMERPEDFAQGLSTQRPFFSGHKGRHGFKFQGTMLPNGIFASLHGSFVGRRHDGYLFRLFPQHFSLFICSAQISLTLCRQSGLNAKVARLQQVCGFRVMNHGDSAYAVNTNTCKGGGYNMSRTRICVEWGFGKIVSKWAGVDYVKRQQLFLTGPGSNYLTAGLLTNIHTCMYGSLTSSYFGVKPPSAAAYLSM